LLGFAARAEAAAFLPKPYRAREVLRLISALLEDPQYRVFCPIGKGVDPGEQGDSGSADDFD
jgi:hypothetical protein